MTRFSRLDALLLLMTVIWGTNYALVKTTFRELDPQAAFFVREIVDVQTTMAYEHVQQHVVAPARPR